MRQTASALRAPKKAVSSLTLQSLDSPRGLVRFAVFASERSARSASAEAYELLFEVGGAWTAAPTHAVYAIWQVAQPQYEAEFIESRRQLFHIRRQALPTFASDWLLKRLDRSGQYLVLGLYGDEAGATRLCREHPAVQQFSQAHPASAYAATDLTGPRCFRVEARMPI